MTRTEPRHAVNRWPEFRSRRKPLAWWKRLLLGTWPVDPSLQLGRETDRATTGFTLSRSLGKLGVTTLQAKFDPDDKKPTLSAIFSIGPKMKVEGEERTLQAVYAIKFQYRNKYDFLNAMGVDARSLPGAGALLNVMNRKAAESATVPANTSAVAAAGQALQQALVPQIFQSASQFEKVTLGSGFQVTLENPLSPGGLGAGKTEVTSSRSMSVLHQERLEPGQKPGEGVRFDEVSVSVGIGGKSEDGGNNVSADGSVAMSYSTDPEKQEEGVGDERRKLAQAIRASGIAAKDPTNP